MSIEIPLLSGGAHGGSPEVELIVVSLVVLVFWAIFRITTRRRA
jgi:hypothetical protein